MAGGEVKAKTTKVAKTATKTGATKKGKVRNYDLGNGVYRFSRTTMFHKKALYKFIGKKTKKTEKPKKVVFQMKPIGGDSNGKERKVYVKKRPKSYPTSDRVRRHPMKKCFSQHKRKFRGSLKPGAVLILLAGTHKGKRVVLLKNLPSGLLLVNGPFTLNGVPLRRVHPNYVIATSAQVDVSAFKMPENVNDKLFKRSKPKKTKKDDGEIFATKKEPYKVSEVRKTIQKTVDKELLQAIKKHAEPGIMRRYLCTTFGLRSSQYPHRMKF